MPSQRMFDSTNSRRGFEAFSFVLVMALCFLGYRMGRDSQRLGTAASSLSGDLGRPAMASGWSSVAQKGPVPASARDDQAKREAAAALSHKQPTHAAHVVRKVARLTQPAVQVPEPLQPAALSLPTGTRLIQDRATAGLGKLETINRTNEDAYVVIVDASTHTRVRQVYVKAKDAFTLEHLDQGRYRAFFTTGLDWDGANEEFKRNASYLDFGEEMSFQEIPSSQGTLYDYRTITLNAVPHGDVRAAAISKAQFHALTGRPLQPARPMSTKAVELPDLQRGGSRYGPAGL